MNIQVNGTEYQIRFKQNKGTGLTVCHFRIADAEFVAETHCSLHDRFSNSSGKKKALLRATKDEANLSKEERYQVWMAYLPKTGMVLQRNQS